MVNLPCNIPEPSRTMLGWGDHLWDRAELICKRPALLSPPSLSLPSLVGSHIAQTDPELLPGFITMVPGC